MRVLFVSHVYFPRINGVSTSIATFRADLATCAADPDDPPVYAGADAGPMLSWASQSPSSSASLGSTSTSHGGDSDELAPFSSPV